MKKLFIAMVAAIGLLAVGCSKYDDTTLKNRVGDLESRVTKLEELCKQMNSNITSLQVIVNAVQDNDYITSVTPVYNGGAVVGYTITFTKSDPITIYHGKDGQNGKDGANGKDGQNGKDGYTPQIGVKQDSDGHYYWTLDGDWLTDGSGQKILAEGTPGRDGTDGTDGQNGADGKDGITPQLKIENDYWYISYDNGQSWQQLGKAAGENGKDGKNGADGQNGADGDAFFSNVDTESSEDYVIFTLADGTQIKLPTWYAFEQLKLLCNQMNINISSLQTIVEAVQDNDYVTSIVPLVEDGKQVGYTITFSKSGTVIIYHGKDGADGKDGQNGKDGANGKDGHTPQIGVKEFEGVLYWTLDGEWLTDDNGQKIPVTGKDGKDGANGTDGKDGQDGTNGKDGQDGKDGITPQLKIEDGCWWISTDNGQTWQNLGKATGENGKDGQNGADGKDGKDGVDGKDGDSIFESVREDTDYVYIRLVGSDEEIAIPKNQPLGITFSDTVDIVVKANTLYTFNYTVTGTESAIVRVLAQDGYSADVKESDALTGSIRVRTPSSVIPSEVLVFVSDGKSRTIMRSINFAADAVIVTDKTYYTGSTGGTVNVEVKTNIDYTVVIAEGSDWVTQVATRALLRTDRLQFSVAENTENAQRRAVIELRNGQSEKVESFMIVQHAGNIEVADRAKGTIESLVGDRKDEIEELVVKGTLDWMDYEFLKTMPKLRYLDISDIDNTTMPASCFSGSKIETVILPSKLTAIPDRAFYQAAITSIIIPETVLSIGEYAFYQCKSIKGDLVIPSYVTTIGDYCFQECTFDGELTLGSDLQTIGAAAFSKCNNFKGDLVIPDGVLTIGTSAFRESKGFTGNLTIGDGCTTIGQYAFYQCTGFTGDLKVGNNVTEIPQYCFYGCSNFAGGITLGNSLTAIGEYAFYNCSKLSGNLIIPDTVESIKSYAFRGCTGLKGYLLLGSGLKSIYTQAFVNYQSDTSYGSTFYYYLPLNFSKIYSKATTAPTCYTSTERLGSDTGSSTKVYPFGSEGYGFPAYLGVPVGCKAAYSGNSGWRSFRTIEEIEGL